MCQGRKVRVDDESFTVYGGASVNGVSWSWPLAKLTVSIPRIVLAVPTAAYVVARDRVDLIAIDWWEMGFGTYRRAIGIVHHDVDAPAGFYFVKMFTGSVLRRMSRLGYPVRS